MATFKSARSCAVILCAFLFFQPVYADDFGVSSRVKAAKTKAGEGLGGYSGELKIDFGSLSISKKVKQGSYYKNPHEDGLDGVSLAIDPSVSIQQVGENVVKLKITSPTLQYINYEDGIDPQSSSDEGGVFNAGLIRFVHESNDILKLAKSGMEIKYLEFDIIFKNTINEELKHFICAGISAGGTLGVVSVEDEKEFTYSHDGLMKLCTGVAYKGLFTATAFAELGMSQVSGENEDDFEFSHLSFNTGVEVSDIARTGLGIYYEYELDSLGAGDISSNFSSHNFGITFQH